MWRAFRLSLRPRCARCVRRELVVSPRHVRFTEPDLYLIERLQEKLGLGMIHVIRLAIRRLAENENLPSSPSVPKKR